MSFLKLCRKRSSCRGYRPTPVPEQRLQYVLECARHAPSAANKQPWRIHIVEGEAKKRLDTSYERPWFTEAPMAVVFTGVSGTNWVRSDGMDYLMCDVAIICDHFTLAAAEVGLGTCWIAAFDKEAVRRALGLPPEEVPFFLTPLGFAQESSSREKQRKTLEEIVVRRTT
ncbi:MAG: nitroreductase family protein [Limnochordia bacterium]|jgi:nitroreductase